MVLNPRFLGMRNHLGPFSAASNQSEGQEQGQGAVGGQGQLQIVTFVLNMLGNGFWCQTQCFWESGIIWNNFQVPQILVK